MSSSFNCSEKRAFALGCAAATVVCTGLALINHKRGCCASKNKSKCNKADEKTPEEYRAIYASEASNNQYMEFHFTPTATSFARDYSNFRIEDAFNFPVRIGRLFSKYHPKDSSVNADSNKKEYRALDLGCATGATSFEMSKYFGEVIGLDLSPAFIQSADKMKVAKCLEFEAPDQGRLTLHRKIDLPGDVFPERCKFIVGDATNVDPALGQFDALIAANLLCRVPDPEKLLQSFGDLILPGGILVLISPYSWTEGATNIEKWIGGVPEKGRSEEAVKKILSIKFTMLDEHDEPFMIRDHSRRFQLGFSHCTVWKRQ